MGVRDDVMTGNHYKVQKHYLAEKLPPDCCVFCFGWALLSLVQIRPSAILSFDFKMYKTKSINQQKKNGFARLNALGDVAPINCLSNS